MFRYTVTFTILLICLSCDHPDQDKTENPLTADEQLGASSIMDTDSTDDHSQNGSQGTETETSQTVNPSESQEGVLNFTQQSFPSSSSQGSASNDNVTVSWEDNVIPDNTTLNIGPTEDDPFLPQADDIVSDDFEVRFEDTNGDAINLGEEYTVELEFDNNTVTNSDDLLVLIHVLDPVTGNPLNQFAYTDSLYTLTDNGDGTSKVSFTTIDSPIEAVLIESPSTPSGYDLLPANVTFTINATNNDGWASLDGVLYRPDDEDLIAGGDYNGTAAWFIFTSVSEIRGRAIDSATLELEKASGGGSADVEIMAIAVDSPTVPTSGTNLDTTINNDATTAKVAWSGSLSAGVNVSPDISAVIQELANTVNSTDVMIVIRGVDSSSGHHRYGTYETTSSPSQPAKLKITYH